MEVDILVVDQFRSTLHYGVST